jgi:nicotinate-nucleotide--dimethylbenzimidazole phosphoribosyltransferase
MDKETWWRTPAGEIDAAARAAALARQATLTKPPGSLGRLEAVAVDLAGMRGDALPRIERPWITVFAGDHGVVAEGVSAFPQEVTCQMLANFVGGGAAVAVLARNVGARLEVVDAGSLASAPMDGVVWGKAGFGTRNFCVEPAMREADCAAALGIGRQAVERAVADQADLFVGGEMGIGNSTAAAALGGALLGLPGAALAGPGTGVDAAGVARKAAAIDRGLARHAALLDDPEAALRCLGGFEIAALAGAFVACAQARLPVLVDGFIATAAALAACRLNPSTRAWLLFGHASAEPGHARLLEALAARPVLQLDMRLGEGSGAAAAIPLLRLACALHAEMATFAQAGVSGRDG